MDRKYCFGLTALLILSGCNVERTPSLAAPSPVTNVAPISSSGVNVDKIVDIPSLVGKTARDVDRSIGKPTDVYPIKNNPERMPGEYRDFRIGSKDDGLSVRFYKNRAVEFMLYLPTSIPASTNALKMAGFDVNNRPPSFRSNLVESWSGQIMGVDYVHVRASKNRGTGYEIVQALIESR